MPNNNVEEIIVSYADLWSAPIGTAIPSENLAIEQDWSTRTEDVTITALDTPYSLPDTSIDAGSVVVTNEAGDTTYVVDTDYSVDATAGTITGLTGGAITALDVVKATYDTNWSHVGYTSDPLNVTGSFETLDVMVEQRKIRVRQFVQGFDFSMSTNMAQMSATNLQRVLGGTLTTTAAGAAQVGFNKLQVEDLVMLPELLWGVEYAQIITVGASVVKLPQRIFVKANASLGGDITIGKATQTNVPITLAGIDYPSFHLVTAQATG